MTPSELYATRQQTGALKLDEAQKNALQAFDGLYHAVIQAAHKTFLQKLFPPKPMALRGLYIWGGVGRGKTMLMDLFVETVSLHAPTRRVHFHDFMREVHGFLHASRQQNKGQDAIPDFCKKVAQKYSVLCFDEFHVTNIADAMILSRLFRTLHAKGVTSVMTSNRAPADLYKGGLQADRFEPFIEHIKTAFEIIHLDSTTDYRLDRLRDATLYITPLSGAAQLALDHIVTLLTDGAAFVTQTLDINGRSLNIQGVHGVARASFADLCEKPLGAPDYLALAERFHTLVLERVPRLTYDRRNEAMRLMTLVDILYDKGVKLVVSAELPPEKLYVGTDHAFEFQRTVSRLLEMQSPAYFDRAA